MKTMREAVYDAIASWYHEQLNHSWAHQTAVPRLLSLLKEDGSIGGKRICDLGCGTGVVSRELARRGARVTGVDISLELLTYARAYDLVDQLGISYLQADAQERFWDGEPFDVVVSNLALIDMPDLAQVAHTVADLLGPGGTWFFSILHPCGPHSTREGNLAHHNYYQEGYWRSENHASVRGQVGSYHRRLSTYFQAFAAVDLRLEGLEEPQPLAPTPASYTHFPALLLMKWRKGLGNIPLSKSPQRALSEHNKGRS